MNMKKVLIILLSFFILFSFSRATFSAPLHPGKIVFKDLFAFDRNKDVSLKLLRDVFGEVNGMLRDGQGLEPQPNVFNLLFYTFNEIMMALATILLSYTLFLGIINTAHEGEFMGKKLHSFWVPLRSVGGFAIIIPTKSGYSLIQVFMMWVIVQGIGAGHQIWTKAVTGLTRLGTIHAVPLVPDLSNYSSNLVQLLADTDCFYQQQYLKSDKTPPSMTASSIRFDYKTNDGAQMTGYSFNCCFSDDGSKDPICTQSSSRGTEPISGNYACPENTFFQNCGILTLNSTAGEEDSRVSDTLLKDIGELFLQSGHSLVANRDTSNYTLSPNPVTTAAGDISRFIQNKQVKAAMEVDSDQEIEAAFGWADAGAYIFKFAQLNTGLSNMTKWSSLGLTVEKCDGKGACAHGTDIAQSYHIPPGVGSALGRVNASGIVQGGKDNEATWYSKRGKSWSGFVNFFTNVIVRYYCIYLFGTNNPEKLYSVGPSGKPYKSSVTMGSGKGYGLHPLFWIQAIGHRFVIVAETVWGMALLISVLMSALGGLCSSYSSGALVVSTILRHLVTPIFMICGMIFSIGLTMEVYIPLIPYIIFTFGVIGWLIAAIETMLAAPLVALGITYPEGHEMMGRADPAVMLLTNIFVRPSFMIFGLVAGLFVSQVAVDFLNHTFSAVVTATSEMRTQTQSVETGIGGFELIMFLTIYISFVIAILNKSFSLINIIPDQVLRWIGGTQQFGEYSRAGEEQIKSAASGAAGAAQQGLQSSTQASGKSMQNQEAKQRQRKSDQEAGAQDFASKDGAGNYADSAQGGRKQKGYEQAQKAAEAKKGQQGTGSDSDDGGG